MAPGDPTRYDRRMSRREVRLVWVPLVLFLSVSGLAFGLAKAHVAHHPSPRSAGPVVLGDPYQGQIVFERSCAPCHGSGGKGGSIGPRLAGSGIPPAAAKAQIDNGGGTMPA